jgi:cytidylate kinase
MTDVTEVMAGEIVEQIDDITNGLHLMMDGRDVGAVLLACAAFLRDLIDTHVDHTEKAAALEMVADEIFPGEDEQ